MISLFLLSVKQNLLLCGDVGQSLYNVHISHYFARSLHASQVFGGVKNKVGGDFFCLFVFPTEDIHFYFFFSMLGGFCFLYKFTPCCFFTYYYLLAIWVGHITIKYPSDEPEKLIRKD